MVQGEWSKVKENGPGYIVWCAGRTMNCITVHGLGSMVQGASSGVQVRQCTVPRAVHGLGCIVWCAGTTMYSITVHGLGSMV